MTNPQRHEDIFSHIIQCYNNLTKSETRVADFVLHNRHIIHSQSISELAAACDVSDATISRFWWFDRFFRADPDTLMARQDNAFYTLGEARISVITGILTGVSITSDHLGRIAPDRLELLGRAARYRLRNAMPADWEPDRWPQIFTGSVDGQNAAAVVNDSDKTMTYDFAALGLTGTAQEVLQPMGKLTGSITLPPHDAALLIQC